MYVKLYNNTNKSISRKIINMKKIILFLILSISSIALNARAWKHYPIEGRDTALYLQKNYVQQKEYFKGKTFSELYNLIKEDINIKNFVTKKTGPWGSDNGVSYVYGLSLSWLTEEQCSRNYFKNSKKVLFLVVIFEPPYTIEAWDFYSKEHYMEDYPKIFKDFKIKDIRLL